MQAPRTATLFKKRLQHRVFPVKFASFFTEHLQWLPLESFRFQPATLLKKRLWQRSQNTSEWMLLVFISEFWEVFQNTSFIEYLQETAISCKSCRFLASRYSKKLFHGCFSSILCKIKKQPFKGVHLLKIPENCLWRNWFVMKLRDAKLQFYEKKTFLRILLHVFSLCFLRIHYDYFFQIGFESVRAQFLSENISGK